MQSFPADFGLTLQPGEIEPIEFEKRLIGAEHQESFDDLGQQILMVKRDVSSPILQRKNDPGSQTLKNLIPG